MSLRGKKIVFALKVAQLKDTRILREMEKMLTERAEICIALLNEGKKGESKASNVYGELFQRLKTQGNFDQDVANNENLGHHPLDLIVVIPDSEELLENLVKAVKAERNIPLMVIVLALKEEKVKAASPWQLLSALMEKRGIFFVPFCPLRDKDTKNKEGGAFPPFLSFYCRLDLLSETCIAALGNYQLEPGYWESQPLPH